MDEDAAVNELLAGRLVELGVDAGTLGPYLAEVLGAEGSSVEDRVALAEECVRGATPDDVPKTAVDAFVRDLADAVRRAEESAAAKRLPHVTDEDVKLQVVLARENLGAKEAKRRAEADAREKEERRQRTGGDGGGLTAEERAYILRFEEERVDSDDEEGQEGGAGEGGPQDPKTPAASMEAASQALEAFNLGEEGDWLAQAHQRHVVATAEALAAAAAAEKKKLAQQQQYQQYLASQARGGGGGGGHSSSGARAAATGAHANRQAVQEKHESANRAKQAQEALAKQKSKEAAEADRKNKEEKKLERQKKAQKGERKR